MTRKQLTKTVPYGLSLYDDFNGELAEVISNLQEAQRLGESQGLTDITLSFDVSYDGETTISVEGKRWETDEEMEKRETKEERANERMEIRERAQMAKLKAKYDGKSMGERAIKRNAIKAAKREIKERAQLAQLKTKYRG